MPAARVSYGTPFEILEAWRRRTYILVTSEEIIAEIERVLRYPRIRERYYVVDQDIERLAQSLRADGLVIPGICQVSGASSDPDNDMFLARAGGTGDSDLLDRVSCERVDILWNPNQFLERLR